MSVLDITSMILENQVHEFRIRWYFIPGYQDAYCVGSDGSVWSCWVRAGWGGKVVVGGPNDWRALRQGRSSDGYLTVVLCLNGVRTACQVSALVAAAFIGPRPLGLEVCHDDGNSQNNHACNLRYDTKKGNQRDRVKHGTDNRGERSGRAFLMWDIIDLIREDWITGKYTQKQLGEKYMVSRSAIYNIIRNESWVRE